MVHWGEIISLIVALSWTVTALFADLASRRLGAVPLNLIRMSLSLVFLGVFLWVMTGFPLPSFTDGRVWFWLALSGLVGYVFGDWCLFNSYVVFGSKYGQLMMTLAPPFAGIAGWLILGETMRWQSWLAMIVTLCGIAMSVLAKGGENEKISLKLPIKGVILGIGAALGQGVGLVLSKIGLEYYSANLPSDVPAGVVTAMPFAGTFIRACAGFVGFFVMLALSKSLGKVREAMHDRVGMAQAVGTTFFGPFLGVSLSLMAVQYAPAGIASTLMALTPVLIIVPYSVINHQRIQVKEVIGTCVTVTGVALFFLL